MRFSDCIALIGVNEYPPYLPSVYERLESEGRIDDMTLVTESFVTEMNERYGILEHSLPSVLDSVRRMRGNAALIRYINTVAEALYDRELAHTAEPPELPEPSLEHPEYNFAGFIAMLPALENAERLMRQRAFPEEVIRADYRHFEYCIDVHAERFGFPALGHNHFCWLGRYLDAVIMEYKGYRFELVRKYADRIILLRSRETGECALLMPNKMMHREGAVLGSADYEDEQGAYLAEFTECDEFYEGYPCDKNGFCTGRKTRYPRPEWELVMRPGDPVINTHFPKGADLKGSAFTDACREAVELFRVSFSDCEPRAFVCCSWLLDPRIDEVCGGAPNIKNFQEKFHLFPIKDGGRDVFNFVFLKPFKSYDELPEDTRLMRGLKKRYIEGKHILDFGGVFPID